MGNQKWTPVSFNGISVDGTGNITMQFRGPGWPYTPGGTDPVEANVVGLGLRDVRAQPRAVTAEAMVTLATHDETNVATMMQVFSERAGLVYLTAKDNQASPVTWRVQCRVIEGPRAWWGTRDHWTVTLRIPSPLWEQNTLNTDTQSNKTASPISFASAAANNAGTRDCDGKFTLTADVAKSINSALNDWPYSFESVFVNRAPYSLENEPIYLMDQVAAARIATNTSAAGCTVIQTTGQTSITADIAAGATTIAVTELSGFNANGGIWTCQDTRGTSYWEQGYYTGKSAASGAGNLTGVVKGRGGTGTDDIAHTIAQVGSLFGPGGTFRNGDDVAVWLDGVRLTTRYLVAWNSAASDIVIPVTVPPTVKLTFTLPTLFTATYPGIGEALNFTEGNGALDDQGFLICGGEVMHYSVKSGDDGVIIDGRGLWGTTAAVHAVGAAVYANPHRVTVGLGWAKAPPTAAASLQTRPAIQLVGSSNQVHKWGDETDDASTIYYDPLYPERPKQWTPGFDDDGNDVSPLMSLSASGTILTFKDDAPGDGKPAYNYAEIHEPCGVKISDVNAIKNDWTPAVEILNLELFTRDGNNTLKMQDQLQQSAAAAARALPATLAAIAYSVKLKGRYNAATGWHTDVTTGFSLSNGSDSPQAVGVAAQGFTLERDTWVSGYQFYASSVSGAQNVKSAIYVDAGGGQPLWGSGNVSTVQPAATTSVNGAAACYSVTFPARLLKAGKYLILIWRSSTTYAPTLVTDATRSYPQGSFEQINTSPTFALMGYALKFRVLGSYGSDLKAPINNDQPMTLPAGTRTATVASFDKTIITLNTSQSVLVVRNTDPVTNGGTGALFHMYCTIGNATNGDSFVVDRWMKPTSTLVIDTKDKTAVYTEDAIAYPVLSALSAAPQLRLAPGDNDVTVTDASLISPGQMDAKLEWRGQRV